ncbi:HtaA domain-containing protein [Salinibacterium sp. ZJ450]|uniref:HtaA domain-containing protein n=1 Tax=Salinibacterium sp. ZJ450 TaxID=2708338 RepID=UPI00142157FE|nr:HtaA domain-containing protein [Salinibacterium sp. ZJ450]
MTPQLTWSIKDTLLAYIEALDDGVVEALAPASRDEAGFLFPVDEAASDFDASNLTGILQFVGTVKLTGHWGMLDVELRDPRIELTGQSGTLLVRERGGRNPGTMLPFASLELDSASATDAPGHIDAAASLTGHGQLLLGGQYRVGEPLSRLRITFPASDE